MLDEMERLVLPCERGRTHTTTTFDRAAFSRVLPGKQHAYGALVITRFRCSLICTSGEGKAQGRPASLPYNFFGDLCGFGQFRCAMGTTRCTLVHLFEAEGTHRLFGDDLFAALVDLLRYGTACIM